MIFITGDTHGGNDFQKLKSIKDKVTDKDYVIILGDFGLLWADEPDNNEKYLTDFYNSFGCPILWLDGNHENFNRIERLEEASMFGGKVGLVTDNIIHLKRGEIYNIDNHSFFVMGGAISIDKRFRIPFLSWWPQEIPNQEECEHALKNLKKHNNSVDYILTHEAPYSFHQEAYNKILEYDFIHFLEDEIKQKVKYKKWFFGHHHMDEVIDDDFIAMYNNIISIDD